MCCVHKLREGDIKHNFSFLSRPLSSFFSPLVSCLSVSLSSPLFHVRLLLSQFLSGPFAVRSQQTAVSRGDEGSARGGWYLKHAHTHTYKHTSAVISIQKSSNYVWSGNEVGRHTDAGRTPCVHLSSFAVSLSLTLSRSLCPSLYRNSGTEAPPPSPWLQPMINCKGTRLPPSPTLSPLPIFLVPVFLIITPRFKHTVSRCQN